MNFEYHKEQKFWEITQGTYIKDLLRLHEPRHQGVIKGRALPEVKQVWSTESAPRRRRAPERQPVHKCSKVGSILVYRVLQADLMQASSTRRSTWTGQWWWTLMRVGRYLLGTMDQQPWLHAATPEISWPAVASDADDAGAPPSTPCYVRWIGPALGDEQSFSCPAPSSSGTAPGASCRLRLYGV
jgi:hypothetical protein